MTEREFFEILNNTSRTWEYTAQLSIRRRVNVAGLEVWQCPITAVLQERRVMVVGTDRFGAAIRYLGLDRRVGEIIADAADHQFGKAPKMCAALLAACGLESKEPPQGGQSNG